MLYVVSACIEQTVFSQVSFVCLCQDDCWPDMRVVVLFVLVVLYPRGLWNVDVVVPVLFLHVRDV